LAAPKGFIALTDPDWYSFLSAHPRVDEVNFWQPHGGQKFRALKRGELFSSSSAPRIRRLSGLGSSSDSKASKLGWPVIVSVT